MITTAKLFGPMEWRAPHITGENKTCLRNDFMQIQEHYNQCYKYSAKYKIYALNVT